MSKNDSGFLKRAIELAIEAIDKGGGPFGAVITCNGKIISEAYNEVVYTGDPTAHAEILAIRKASEAVGSHILENCILYASCEPCPMCLGAVYWSGIKEVIYAADRTDAEKAGFGDRLFYEEILKDPGKRKVRFKRIKSVGGTEPFIKWDSYEYKVRY